MLPRSFDCTYCKGTGHFIQSCLKRITKNCPVELCRDYNRFKHSTCDIDGECCYDRQHTCSICNQRGCKAYYHVNFENGKSQDLPQQNAAILTKMETILNKMKDSINSLYKTIKTEKETTQVLRKAETRDHERLNVNLDHYMAGNATMALPCTSAGQQISMVLMPSLPLSAVLLQHANVIVRSTQETPITPVDHSRFNFSSENSSALTLCGTVIVPITFRNDRMLQFQMIVLDGLSENVIFANNHMEKTNAILDYAESRIIFRTPDLNFALPCERYNHPVTLLSLFDHT